MYLYLLIYRKKQKALQQIPKGWKLLGSPNRTILATWKIALIPTLQIGISRYIKTDKLNIPNSY